MDTPSSISVDVLITRLGQKEVALAALEQQVANLLAENALLHRQVETSAPAVPVAAPDVNGKAR